MAGAFDASASLVLVVALAVLACGVWNASRASEPQVQRHRLTEAEHQELLRTHQFVVLGGTHGSGAALLMRLLSANPSVAGLPERIQSSGLRWPSEGGFLQSVIPTLGITSEARSNGRFTETSGMGRYAFDAAAHLTETHALNTKASSLELLSEWAPHWNLSRPVLLEKTPAHMLSSRLLQGLLAPNANFLFITRHPLAVSLAHRRMPSCKAMSAASLTLHWVASHRVLAMDAPHLKNVRLVRYEDLAGRTRSCLADDVLPWLQLSSRMDLPRRIDADANQKYETQYCGHLLRTPAQVRRHCALAAALQPAIGELGLGYDIRFGGRLAFSCIRREISNATGMLDPCAGVPAAKWVVRELEKQREAHGAAVGAKTHAAVRPLGAKLLCPVAPKKPSQPKLAKHKARRQKPHSRPGRPAEGPVEGEDDVGEEDEEDDDHTDVAETSSTTTHDRRVRSQALAQAKPPATQGLRKGAATLKNKKPGKKKRYGKHGGKKASESD